MAIDDLGALREQLPRLFEDHNLPEGWGRDWIFIPTEATGNTPEPLFQDEAGLSDLPTELPQALEPEFPTIVVPDIGGYVFPGSPSVFDRGGSGRLPPPDCLGFYLPFHHYHPIWWGIYIIKEGLDALARFIYNQASGIVTYSEADLAARVFIFGHEAFHHVVESFATRLEVTHRLPLYRRGFNDYYTRTAGTDDWIEEALASSHGFRRVSRRFKAPLPPDKREAVLDALAEYIRESGAGYNRALEFVPDGEYYPKRSWFAEENQAISLPDIETRVATVWLSFPHAFSGIARVNSRVNYVIHRGSPLAQRMRDRGHYLRYGDLAKLLKQHGCAPIGKGKGSHEKWERADGRRFPVPRHPREFKTGLLRALIREAGLRMSVSEFIAKAPQ